MESSLTAAFNDLLGDVGHFLGYGRGATNGEEAWDDFKTADVERSIKGGMRKFYFCGYDWTFLKPTVSLVLDSGAQQAEALPDDFGGFEGDVTISAVGSTTQPWRIKWVSEPTIRGFYASNPTLAGPPMYVAELRQRGTSKEFSSRSELLVFPAADQAYTLKVQYYLNPDYLTGSKPYAYGGPQHSETLLEACLQVAEIIKDDMSGPHAQEFDRLLEISKDIDRRNKPQSYGPNRDTSDELPYTRKDTHYWAPAATYNGASFG
jgi:hypothetical protein